VHFFFSGAQTRKGGKKEKRGGPPARGLAGTVSGLRADRVEGKKKGAPAPAGFRRGAANEGGKKTNPGAKQWGKKESLARRSGYDTTAHPRNRKKRKKRSRFSNPERRKGGKKDQEGALAERDGKKEEAIHTDLSVAARIPWQGGKDKKREREREEKSFLPAGGKDPKNLA